MPADSKKIQTLINEMASVVETVRSAQTIKDKYVAANPNVTATPLAGKTAAVNTWLTALLAIGNDPIAQAFLDNKIESHRGKAL